MESATEPEVRAKAQFFHLVTDWPFDAPGVNWASSGGACFGAVIERWNRPDLRLLIPIHLREKAQARQAHSPGERGAPGADVGGRLGGVEDGVQHPHP